MFRRVVLGVLVLAFVAGAIVLWQTGVATPANVRDWLDSLGPAAPLLFGGQFDELFGGRQVSVVPAFRSRLSPLLSAWSRVGRS